MEIGKNIKVRDLPSPNNVTLMGNKTVFVLEDYYKTTKKNDYVGQANINDPTVVKKKHLNCICKLSTCKCSTIDDPEKWFVKTYLNKNSKIRTGKYYISNRTFHSPKTNTLDYSEMINGNLGGVRKNWGNAFDYRFEENYKTTKNRYRFLPMSNFNKKKITNCRRLFFLVFYLYFVVNVEIFFYFLLPGLGDGKVGGSFGRMRSFTFLNQVIDYVIYYYYY